MKDLLNKPVLFNRTPPVDVTKYIRYKRGGSINLIPINDIFYFQADRKYVDVVYRKGEGVLTAIIEESVTSLMKDLSDTFLKISHGTIVKKSLVIGINGEVVNLYGLPNIDGHHRLKVSRRNLPTVRKFIREKVNAVK